MPPTNDPNNPTPPNPAPPAGTPPAAGAPPAADEPPAWLDDFRTSLVNEFNDQFTKYDEKLDNIAVATAPPAGGAGDDPDADWKPNAWSDIPKTARQIAEDVYQENESKREQLNREQQEASEKAQKEIDLELDRMVGDLEKANRIPAGEQGREARQELYGYAIRLNTTDLVAVADALDEFHSAGKKYDIKTGKLVASGRPAGAQAPVGSSSSSTGNQPATPDYKTIHNLSMDELIRRAGR